DHVLITNENGVFEDIVFVTEAGNDLQEFSGILSPGFINCHCHLELSHMKGLIAIVPVSWILFLALCLSGIFPKKKFCRLLKRQKMKCLPMVLLPWVTFVTTH